MSNFLGEHSRLLHMEIAITRDIPRLTPDYKLPKKLNIVGYGSSLRDTWKEIEGPVLSLSGAGRFLQDRGIPSDFYLGVDPRPHKTDWLKPASPNTIYLMSSAVHPDTWDLVPALMFHCIGLPSLEERAKKDPGTLALKGGPDAGITATRVAKLLGVEQIHLFGMDHFYGYADVCNNPYQNIIYYNTRQTSAQLILGAQALKEELTKEVTLHGEFLLDG